MLSCTDKVDADQLTSDFFTRNAFGKQRKSNQSLLNDHLRSMKQTIIATAYPDLLVPSKAIESGSHC